MKGHEYLTIRNGVWQYYRRVPAHFAHLDTRGTVKLSTKVSGNKASRGRRSTQRHPGSLLARPVRTERHRRRARL
jgi:hypothetical protein